MAECEDRVRCAALCDLTFVVGHHKTTSEMIQTDTKNTRNRSMLLCGLLKQFVQEMQNVF